LPYLKKNTKIEVSSFLRTAFGTRTRTVRNSRVGALLYHLQSRQKICRWLRVRASCPLELVMPEWWWQSLGLAVGMLLALALSSTPPESLRRPYLQVRFNLPSEWHRAVSAQSNVGTRRVPVLRSTPVSSRD
jgi:hypothetical protein